MTPRDYIGDTFIVKRADELRLGDEVLVYSITDGLYHGNVVTSLQLVGDDVVVNEQSGLFSTWETSQGNAVLVQVHGSP